MLNRDFKYDPIQVTKIKVDVQSHIKVKEQKNCQGCSKKPCTYICPSQVYEWKHGVLQADYPRCVECGACVLACPKDNLDWNYPQGGYGVCYHH